MRDPLRDHLLRLLRWEDAHVGFDAAVAGLPPDLYGRQPDGLPYSPWQLLEHMRIAQRDILAFCRDPGYVAPSWPDDYWPEAPAPDTPGAWAEAVTAFRADRAALMELVSDADLDLQAQIPHGSGQTYLREILLVADHTAYHLGQLIVVRRLLGAWEG